MVSEKPLGSRYTPLDANTPKSGRTCCKLVIYPSCSVEEITEILGIAPSSHESQNIGQIIVNSRGRQRTAKLTCWCLTSDDIVASLDVRHHLDWLLQKLEGAEDQLRQVQGLPDTQMFVNCIWYSRHVKGPTLWPEQMAALSRLNLECSFDIYWDYDEDD